jgi:hypothetical protein
MREYRKNWEQEHSRWLKCEESRLDLQKHEGKLLYELQRVKDERDLYKSLCEKMIGKLHEYNRTKNTHTIR